jgi:hypothetical protein
MINNTLSDETIEKLESITEELNGNIRYLTTLDHAGTKTKKIMIEYDKQLKEN